MHVLYDQVQHRHLEAADITYLSLLLNSKTSRKLVFISSLISNRTLLGEKDPPAQGFIRGPAANVRVTFDGLSRKSLGGAKPLSDAEEYQSGRGIPPPGYQKWLEFAKERQCHLGPYKRIDTDLDVSFSDFITTLHFLGHQDRVVLSQSAWMPPMR